MPIQQIQSTKNEQVVKAISSDWFVQAIDRIEKKLNLHIDQAGELYMIVSEIMLGSASSQDFIPNVTTRLQIDEKTANEIAAETNVQVFNVLKNTLQTKSTETLSENGNDSMNSSLQSIGGISIEKPDPESESAAKVTAADRGNILAGLENPPSSVPRTSQPPQNLPMVEEESGPFSESEAPKTTPKEENHTEPLVDYLLSKPAGQSVQHVTASPDSAPASSPRPKNPVPPSKPPTRPDPYREAVK